MFLCQKRKVRQEKTVNVNLPIGTGTKLQKLHPTYMS